MFIPLTLSSLLRPSRGERQDRDPHQLVEAKVELRADVCTGVLESPEVTMLTTPLALAHVRFTLYTLTSWRVGDALYALDSAIYGLVDAGVLASAASVGELSGTVHENSLIEALRIEVSE